MPRPLGAVVFHYHQTQDYPPEFASMTAPNDDVRVLDGLEQLGMEAVGLEDVLLLTTEGTLETRRREFLGVRA